MNACVCVHVGVCMALWPALAFVFLCARAASILHAWLHEFTFVFLDLRGDEVCLCASVRAYVLCIGGACKSVCACMVGTGLPGSRPPLPSPGPLSEEGAATPAAKG